MDLDEYRRTARANLDDTERDYLMAGTDDTSRHAHALDAADAARRTRLGAPDALRNGALYYASQGVAVFPLRPGGKIPLPGSAGFKDATVDPAQVAAWWTEHAQANIGLPTGLTFDVIDIDGPAGVKAWAAMVDTIPPILGHVSTPRPGGSHLYIAPDPARGNRAAIVEGVDYRGRGGYVIAPPSRLTERRKADGSIEQHGGTYRWLRPLTRQVGG